jgi:hypothetical protein
MESGVQRQSRQTRKRLTRKKKKKIGQKRKNEGRVVPTNLFINASTTSNGVANERYVNTKSYRTFESIQHTSDVRQFFEIAPKIRNQKIEFCGLGRMNLASRKKFQNETYPVPLDV